MTEATLNYMKKMMQSIGIPYEFLRWNAEKVPEVYFVGEYIEHPSPNRSESGRQENTFILRGFTRGTWMGLEQAKAKIEANACKTAILDDGTGIAVFYDDAKPVPTADATLKSIKINLNIQEWRVN